MLDLGTGDTSNETESKEIWEKSVFTGSEFDVWKSSFKFDDSLRDGQIRVKYLDKEDIESLGFKLKVENKYGITFTNRLYSIVCSKMKSDHLEILLAQPYVNEYDGLKFSGVIKNKSELKRILKMIGHGN